MVCLVLFLYSKIPCMLLIFMKGIIRVEYVSFIIKNALFSVYGRRFFAFNSFLFIPSPLLCSSEFSLVRSWRHFAFARLTNQLFGRVHAFVEITAHFPLPTHKNER